jgi:hypothetical protein
MSLLSDERDVWKFIECGDPCSSELLIEYYLKCKRNESPVPEKINDFITTCLSKILKARNQGSRPRYDEIFGFTKINNRIPKRTVTVENEMLLIGFAVDDLIDGGEKKATAFEKVASAMTVKFNRSVSIDIVRKAYKLYEEIPQTLDECDQLDYDD